MAGFFGKLFTQNKIGNSFLVPHKLFRSASVKPETDEHISSNVYSSPSCPSAYSEDQECIRGRLFRCALSVVQNYLGKPAHPFTAGPRQLYKYITTLFDDISPTERQTLEKESDTKVYCILKATVRDASVSQSKELTHVYCKLWITPEMMQFTTSRPNCDLLWWDECFVLDIGNSQEDAFHIEMWSEYPHTVGGFFTKLVHLRKKPVEHKDMEKATAPHSTGKYFIGEAIVPIHNIPSDGADVSVQLRKGPRGKVIGQIKISYEFSSKPREDHISLITLHLLLMKRCFEKQQNTIKNSELWKNWMDVLPSPGLSLIHQHALQNGLNMAEQTLCSWLVMSSLKIKNESRVSFSFLHSLLNDVTAFLSEEGLDEDLESALRRSKEKFCDYLHTLLKKLHLHFLTFDAANLNEMGEMLRCLAVVDESKTDSYSRSVSILEGESYSFYLSVVKEYQAMLQDSNPTEEICGAINEIMRRITIDQVTLDSVFRKAWFKTYTQITHQKLDSAASSIIKPIIQHLCSQVWLTKNKKKRFEEVKKMLLVYFNIRDLVDYIVSELPEPRDRLAVEQFSSWFGDEMIIEWFRMASDMSHQFIIKAVKADILEPVNSEIKHGTSVSDVIQVINQLVIKLWMKLEWEDQFYTHTALVEALKACATTYVNAMAEKLSAKKFKCVKNHFVINLQHCVILSNVYAVFEHLNVTENEIKDIVKRAEEDFSIAIVDHLDVDHNELLCSISNVFEIFFNKVSACVLKLSMKVIKSGPSQEEAVYQLYKFVDTSLHTMRLHVTPNLFNLILREMWAITVNSLHSSFKATEAAIQGVSQSLNLLRSVFHGEKFGLSLYEMQNRNYTELMEFVKSGRGTGASTSRGLIS